MVLAAALALALAGCGGGSPGPDLGNGREGDERGGSADAAVVRRWADTLRRGDVAGAARLFALPVRVANGTPLVTLRSRRQVRGFNRALPCGARVLKTTPHHGYVIAEFRLIDRRGPGAVPDCPGRGAKAATAFKVVSGHITEWRRVPVPGEDGRPSTGTPA
jgi:hypothetical protein